MTAKHHEFSIIDNDTNEMRKASLIVPKQANLLCPYFIVRKVFVIIADYSSNFSRSYGDHPL
jgi:hypothetical protein